VLISEDLDEIFDLSDRILVIYEGELVHETVPEEADRERVGLEMTGGSTTDEESPPPEVVRSEPATKERSEPS